MNEVNPPPTTLLTLFRRHRYSVLLAAIVALLISSPILRELRPSTGTGLAEIGLTAVFVVLLLSAIPVVGQKRSTFVIAVLLSGITIILYVVTLFFDDPWITIVEQIFTSAFLTVTLVAILRFVFITRRVTLETIWAALCVYLLLGLVWASVYSIVDIVQPESFLVSWEKTDDPGRMRFGTRHSSFAIYYSFVTMSTLGYGDIVPKTPTTRMLAAIQAIIGQFYLTVLVARLVALHIVHSKSAKG
jgi:hypothetical protein